MQVTTVEILNQSLYGKKLITYEYWTEINGVYMKWFAFFSKSQRHCDMGCDEKIVKRLITKVELPNREEVEKHRVDFTIITDDNCRWPFYSYSKIEIEL